MKKIRLIIPYFGKLPKFFPYFLLTAKRNQKIDFLIYTDQNVDQFEVLNADNIEFKTLSFDDLRKKYSLNLILKFLSKLRINYVTIGVPTGLFLKKN